MDSIAVKGVREMARKQLRFGQGFSVVLGNRRAQVATMVLALRARTLLLIEPGTTHEIRNTGRTPLKTLNFYLPPAYTSKRDPLPRGRK
jgi:oxalate decarboxylase/phosphoglucose isomerase-like protein (cupin superfamily)